MGIRKNCLSYENGIYKLCVEIEEASYHIITECEVMKACINDFQTTLLTLHGEQITKDEMAFGLVGNPIGEMSRKANLRNYITFIIRHVVFKNRYIDFWGIERAKLLLKNKVRDRVKKELLNKWIEHRERNAKEEYANKYLIENILGRLENDNLILSI